MNNHSWKEEVTVPNLPDDYITCPSMLKQPDSECVVCREAIPLGGGVNFYTTVSSTTLTHMPDLLMEVVVRKTGEVQFTFRNSMICNRCSNLLNRADELRHLMGVMKLELQNITHQMCCFLNIPDNDDEEDNANNTVHSQYRTNKTSKHRPDNSQKVDTIIQTDPYYLTETMEEEDQGLECQFCTRSSTTFKNKVQLASHFDQTHSQDSHVMCQICNEAIPGGVKTFLLHLASDHPKEPIRQGIGILKVKSTSSTTPTSTDAYKVHIPRLDIFAPKRVDFDPSEERLRHERLQMVLFGRKLKVSALPPLPKRPAKRPTNSPCRFCNKIVNSRHMKRHISYHHSDEKRHKCNLCPEAFSKGYQIHVHMKNVHGIITNKQVKKNQCPDCGKLYINNFILRKHVRTVHENRRDYLCSICGVKYKSQCALKVHLRRHSGAKPYTCTLCGKSYHTAGTVRKHVKKVHNIDNVSRLNDPCHTNPYVSVDHTIM